MSCHCYYYYIIIIVFILFHSFFLYIMVACRNLAFFFSALATFGVWFFTFPARAKLPCTCDRQGSTDDGKQLEAEAFPQPCPSWFGNVDVQEQRRVCCLFFPLRIFSQRCGSSFNSPRNQSTRWHVLLLSPRKDGWDRFKTWYPDHLPPKKPCALSFFCCNFVSCEVLCLWTARIFHPA